jgi:hypothetical protein
MVCYVVGFVFICLVVVIIGSIAEDNKKLKNLRKELIIGSTWFVQFGEEDPFIKPTRFEVEIVDIKDEYVQYKYSDGGLESCEFYWFVKYRCFKPLKTEIK